MNYNETCCGDICVLETSVVGRSVVKRMSCVVGEFVVRVMGSVWIGE